MSIFHEPNSSNLSEKQRLEIEKVTLLKTALFLIIPSLFIVVLAIFIFPDGEFQTSIAPSFSDYQWYSFLINFLKAIIFIGIPLSYLSFQTSISFYYLGFETTSKLLLITYLLLHLGFFFKRLGII